MKYTVTYEGKDELNGKMWSVEADTEQQAVEKVAFEVLPDEFTRVRYTYTNADGELIEEGYSGFIANKKGFIARQPHEVEIWHNGGYFKIKKL